MNVCVVGGAGHVGLITGLGVAELGHRVINVDTDRDRIHQLQDGRCPIYPESTEGRREDSGRGWVRELQGRWPGVLG